jgi:hypothetical protein
MKNLKELLIYSLFVGFILTLVSFVSTVDISFEGYAGLGTYRGFPFTWLHTNVFGTGSPMTYTKTSEIWWGGLVLDFIFWSVVSFVILFFYLRNKKKK